MLTNTSFGRRLRHERERRQISLESIAANTKIGVGLLAGLERDDVSRWPAGIFRRAFIRAYAGAVGLDADATLREFLERFPDPMNERAPGPRTETTGPPLTPGVAEGTTVLRLTLADVPFRFRGGHLLAGPRSRCAAVGCDLSAVLALGVALFLVVGAFWMPLAVATAGYYGAAILLLGNTPGVCLFAPASRDRQSRNRAGRVLPEAWWAGPEPFSAQVFDIREIRRGSRYSA